MQWDRIAKTKRARKNGSISKGDECGSRRLARWADKILAANPEQKMGGGGFGSTKTQRRKDQGK